MTKKQSRAQGVLKARQRKEVKVQASSSYSSSHSARIFTPGSSPKLETPSPQTQDGFHATAGHLPDLHFLDVFDVASSNNTSFLNHDATDELSDFIASPLLYSLNSFENSPYIDVRLSLSPEQSPQTYNSLAMSWTQIPPFGRSPSSDRGRSSSQNIPVTTSSDNIYHGSPQVMVSPSYEQYPTQNANNVYDYAPVEAQYFDNSFATMVSSPDSFGPRLVTDALLFGDNSMPTYTYGYQTQQQWTPVANQSPSQHLAITTPSPRFSTNSGQFLASPPAHQMLGSSSHNFGGRRQPSHDNLSSDFSPSLHAGTPSPLMEYENDGWMIPSIPSSNYALSHNSHNSHHSPASLGSPVSRASPSILDSHHHVVDADPAVAKPKGRQRSLTAKEKKDARDVRDAKACWACHISKTKCSPCSPGNPCAQCARLVGKRRFCRFDCFNDPLESLYTFMVPEYSMSRFQEAEVASLLSTVAWTKQKLRVRLSWGYCHTLEVDCVRIDLRDARTNPLTFQHQVLPNGQDKPIIMRKLSPPLGVPSESVRTMETIHEKYISRIVESNLDQYVLESAYNDDDSDLPRRLLGAICDYYQRCSEAEEECDLLRQTIEMHITSTILQRSLNIAEESVAEVQANLQEFIPERVVPKCAARQVKLSFFTMQRLRIQTILKDWGNLMWAIHNANNNAERWATTFSVFIMLVLVVDKTLGAAHSLCESRIEYRNSEAKAERAEFRKLVRLTETELFDRCKEIFHWKFKTRKGGKEACNPIRDGMLAFRGRPCTRNIAQYVHDLQILARDFDPQIRNHSTIPPSSAGEDVPYVDCGRLACVFLDDFLENT